MQLLDVLLHFGCILLELLKLEFALATLAIAFGQILLHALMALLLGVKLAFAHAYILLQLLNGALQSDGQFIAATFGYNACSPG